MEKSGTHFISLIVPAYKQAHTIVRNILQLQRALEKNRYPYEIIVVIDGIVDQTLARLKKRKIPRTMLVSYPKNHGKAYAIRLGMKKAKGDYVMFIDSGMEINPRGISMLIEHMEWYSADIIVGSKRHPVSQVEYSTLRKVLSYGYYYFVKMLFGIKIRDTQAGIKVFKKKVLVKVLPRLVEKRFAGDLEMLVVAHSLGFKKIFEAPIRLNYSFSKMTSAATWNSIFRIFLDTLAIYYRKNFLRYYIKAHRKFTFPQGLAVTKFSPTTKRKKKKRAKK